MPTTTLTVDSEDLVLVGIRAAERARDLDYVATPLLKEQARVWGEGKPFVKGGFRWQSGVALGQHSQPTRVRTGYEQFDLSFSSTLRPIALTPAEVGYPVGISATEEDIAADPNAALELADQRVQKVMLQAKRDWERNSLRDGVVGWDDFLTLNGTDDTVAGLVEEDAPGAQDNVIGGFSKAANAAIEGASNQSFDIQNTANTRMLAALYQLRIRTQNRASDPTAFAWILSELGMENFKRTTQANERYMPAPGKADSPIDPTSLALMIGGVPAHGSTLMPNAGANTTANPWSVLGLDFKAIYFKWSKAVRDGYFGLGPWEPIGGDYAARVAKITVRGQWWPETWASSALAIRGETF